MAVCIAARLRSTDRKQQRPKEEEESQAYQPSSKFCRRREELEWKVAAMFAMTEYLGDIGRLA